MIELLRSIVAELVDDKDAIQISADEPNEEGFTLPLTTWAR